VTPHTDSITHYGWLIADSVRTDAYARALRQAVNPDSAVLDIGTGTGIFALLACQFGARRVYAIESNNLIQVAREIAAANGYSDRIEFIQDVSTRVTLPEKVDVVVSEIHDVLPLFTHSLVSIADARRRMLAPNGTLIPQYETLWAAVVEAPDLYGGHVRPWEKNRYGLDMVAGRRYATNAFRRTRVTPEQLLTEARSWARLDYAILNNPDVCGEVAWTAARAGIGRGLSIWFDATLAEGVRFSNGPDAPELVFGSAFFPWSEPVTIAVGDTVAVALRANLVGEDYVWRWDTRVLDQGRPGRVKAHFNQSTFFGMPLTPAHLRKLATDHVPALNEDGQIDRCILELMGGGISLGDIASRVFTQFPTRFAKWQEAMNRVGELSEKYSR